MKKASTLWLSKFLLESPPCKFTFLIDFLYKILYIYYMFDVTALFSSKAKVKVLRTLFYQSTPLPLRHIASLSDASLFSVQRVLKHLVAEGILIRKRKGRYTLFSLNPNHEYHSFLTQLFDLEMKSRIASLAGDYHQKAKGIVDFSRSARDLFEKVRP